MVKTRSNIGNSGDETTAESEVHTEYSSDFDSEDEVQGPSQVTIIKGPMKSQSTPIMSHHKSKGETPKRYQVPIDVHEHRMSPERPVSTGDRDEKQTERSELLAGMTEMRSMMTTFMQAMQGVTRTLTNAHDVDPPKDVNETSQGATTLKIQSHRSRSSTSTKSQRRPKQRHSNPEVRLRSRRYERDSSCESTSSSSSDDETNGRNKGSSNGARLPAFTGKEKWKVWFNRFQSVADLHGWSKRERLAELLPRLQGTAGEFVYDQLSREIRNSYRKLIKELDNRFREVDTTKIYITKFYNKRQVENESAQEFAAELKRLYDKGFPTRDKVTRNEDLLRQYLLGLSDEGARIHVELNKDPRTIDEAVYFTVHYQETCGYPMDFHDYNSRSNYKQKRPLRQIQQSPRPNRPNHDPTSYGNRGQRQSRSNFNKREEKRCFNCNSLDHFIRDCPEPRQPREGNYGYRTPHYQQRFNKNYSRQEREPSSYSRNSDGEGPISEAVRQKPLSSAMQPSLNPAAPEFNSKPKPLNC